MQKLDIRAIRALERVLEKVKVAAIKIKFYFKQLFQRIAENFLARACVCVLLEWAHTENIFPDYFFIAAHQLECRKMQREGGLEK